MTSIQKIKSITIDTLLSCPKYGSQAVAIGKRGYSISTGFLDGTKTVNLGG